MFLAQRCNGNHLPFGDSPKSGQWQAGLAIRLAVHFSIAIVMLRPSRKQNDLLSTRDHRVPAADSLAGGAAFLGAD